VPGLQIHDGAVVDLVLEQQQQQGSRPQVVGVLLASGEVISCRAVVVTTGTFLRGIIHVGSASRPAGRMPSSASTTRAPGGEQLACCCAAGPQLACCCAVSPQLACCCAASPRLRISLAPFMLWALG
jgi:hypothetical protein